MNDTEVNKDKGAQRRQRMFVKVTIPVMKPVLALKKIEKQVKREILK